MGYTGRSPTKCWAAIKRKKKTKAPCLPRVKLGVKWTQSLKATDEDPGNSAVVMVTVTDTEISRLSLDCRLVRRRRERDRVEQG